MLIHLQYLLAGTVKRTVPLPHQLGVVLTVPPDAPAPPMDDGKPERAPERVSHRGGSVARLHCLPQLPDVHEAPLYGESRPEGRLPYFSPLTQYHVFLSHGVA